MKRVCMQCHKTMGEKEPLEDKNETHGFCVPCLEDFRKQKKEKKRRSEVNEIESIKVMELIFTSLSKTERRVFIDGALLFSISQDVEHLPLDEAIKKGAEMIEEYCERQKRIFINGYEKIQKEKIFLLAEHKKTEVVH